MGKKTQWQATANEREVAQRRYLAEFGKYHYAWLRKIGEEWKKRGQYAFDRFSLMDYYQANEDIETAGYVSLLTRDNGRLHDQITELRNLIGREPWEWVKSRGFIVLSRPEVSHEWIVGTGRQKWELFNLLDWVWGRFFGGDPRNADTHDTAKPRCTVADVVKIEDERYMLDMMAVRLVKRDGIGKGVLPDYGAELSCPVNDSMLKVIRAFYPKNRRYGLNVDSCNADDVLMFMGFDDPTEFIYCYQGYCRMRELMPEAMERNERLFQKRYIGGWLMDEGKSHFRQAQTGMLPEIRFE